MKEEMRNTHTLRISLNFPEERWKRGRLLAPRSGAGGDEHACHARERLVGVLEKRPVAAVLLVIEGDKGTIITNDPDNITIRNQNYTLGNTVSDGKIILN